LRAFVLFALITLAAGCPQQPSPAATAQLPPVDSAAPVTITKGALPAGWPSIIPVYTQAAIIEGRATASGAAPLLTAILATPAAAEDVHAFYGQQLSPHQFAVVSSSETKGEKVSLYRRDGQSLSVSTTRDDPAGETRIELTLAGRYEPRVGEPRAARPDPPAKTDKNEPPAEQKQAESTHPLLPLYPGTKGDTKLNGPRVTLRLTTPDTLEQVCAFYEQFYRSQGLQSAGRSEFTAQVSETFTGPAGTALLNVRRGSPTSINLSFEGGAPVF
jgi:hypothetical protein